jgi:ferredoxin-NADP reductase
LTTTDRPTFETQVLARDDVAENTMAFYLVRPEGFDFKAGQFLDLTIIDPPQTDDEGNTRTFSIASAPFEPGLMIATRLRNTAFKRVLAAAPPKMRLHLEGPSGSFTLHRNAQKPAVFLAGGIGITPFLSMVRDAHHEHLPHEIYLLYGNRRPEDAAFLDLLGDMAAANAKLHFVPVMSEMGSSHRPWDGEVGMISKDLLARHLPTIQGPIYYIAGPPGMVASLRKVLAAAGVDEDDIRTEEFSGY